MKMISECWAIDSREPPYRLIGVYWFQYAPCPSNRGCTVALFKTRAEARKALKRVKGPYDRGGFPKAAVVKVRVTVEA